MTPTPTPPQDVREAAFQSNVVDVVEQIKARRAVEQYARLWGLVERYYEDVAKNPHPFLSRAAHEVGANQFRMEEIRSAIWHVTAPKAFDPKKPLQFEHPFQNYYEAVQVVLLLLNQPLKGYTP